MNHVGTIIATVITSLLIIGGTFLVLYFVVWKNPDSTSPSETESDTPTPPQGDGTDGDSGNQNQNQNQEPGFGNTPMIQPQDPDVDPNVEPVVDPVEDDDTTFQKDDSTTVFDVDDLPDVINIQGDDMDVSQTGIYQVTSIDDITWTGTSWDTSSIFKLWKHQNTIATDNQLLILYQDAKGAVNWYITHTDYSTKYLSNDISQTLDPLTTTSWTKSDDGSSITISLTDILQIATSAAFTVSGDKTKYNGIYTEYTMDGSESWSFIEDGNFYIRKTWIFTNDSGTNRFAVYYYTIESGKAQIVFLNTSGIRKIWAGRVDGENVENGIVSQFGGTWTTDKGGTDIIDNFNVTEIL